MHTETEPLGDATNRTGILLSLAISTGLVLLVELLQLPRASFQSSPTNALGFVAIAVFASVRFLWVSILCQLLFWASLFLPVSVPPFRRIFQASSVALGLVFSGHSYSVLAEYPPFAEAHLFKVGFLFFSLYTIAWMVSQRWDLFSSDRTNHRCRVVFAGISIALAVTSYGLNYRLFVGNYESLHASVLQISHFLMFTGIASWLSLKKRSIRIHRKTGLSWAAVGLLVISLCAVTSARWTDPSLKSTFGQYSLLGRSMARGMAEFDSEERVPIAPMSEEAALRIFEKQSRLPRLGATFLLESYNVLLVSLEATRYMSTSFGNPRQDDTPRMAAFAREKGAFVFRRAFAPSSTTIQSMGSLFSLTYPSLTHFDIGPRAFDGALLPANVTIPQVLARDGYRTFWVGHNYHGCFTERVRGFQGLFDTIQLYDEHIDPQVLKESLSRIALASRERKRFFGWVFFESPHLPYSKRYDNLPADSDQQRYRHEIRYVDRHVGALLDGLEKQGLLQNTIVVVHGDHGEAIGEHRTRTHGSSLYGEQSRVPLVVYVPGMKGTVMEVPTSVGYVFPWLFLKGKGAARALAKERLQEDIGPMMRETGGAVISELLRRDRMISSIVSEREHIIYNFNSDYREVYDLATDPKEARNLYGRDERQTRRADDVIRAYLRVRNAKRQFRFVSR